MIRYDRVPATCPRCGRDQTRMIHSPGQGKMAPVTGGGWHVYRSVPDAPAAGCGACGFLLYITEAEMDRLRAGVQEVLPKAAAGQIRKKVRA